MGKKPELPCSIPSYQLSSILLVKVMMSPSLKPSSPSFSGSKSYSARQEGWSSGAGESVDTRLEIYQGDKTGLKRSDAACRAHKDHKTHLETWLEEERKEARMKLNLTISEQKLPDILSVSCISRFYFSWWRIRGAETSQFTYCSTIARSNKNQRWPAGMKM